MKDNAKEALALSDEVLHECFSRRGFLNVQELEEVAAYNKVGSWDALLTLLRERHDRGELPSGDYELECVDIDNLRALEKRLGHTLSFDFATGALHSVHYDSEPPCICGIITASDRKYLDSKERLAVKSDDESDDDEEYDEGGEGGPDDDDAAGANDDDAGAVKIPRLTPDVRKRMRGMLEEGISVREIAREIGAAKGTVSYWKKKMGL